ncbi:MAG: hypothetical protein R2911_42700 [Caldilineaceae bacterium]
MAKHRVVSSVLTDGNGFYEFTGLLPGRYSLQFVRPTSLVLPSRTAATWVRSPARPTRARGAPRSPCWSRPRYLGRRAGGGAGRGFAGQLPRHFSTERQRFGDQRGLGHLRRAGHLLVSTFSWNRRETFGSARQMTSQIIPSEGSDGGVYHFAMSYDPPPTPPIESLLVWLVETDRRLA